MHHGTQGVKEVEVNYIVGPHATKKLLRDAIVEYKIIMEYLARLLHAAETHGLSTTTTTTTITAFPHSTVRHIPYPIKVHPLFSNHSSVPYVSSKSTPLPSTSSTSSSLPSEPVPLIFTTTTPKVSFTGTASSLLIPPPASILLVNPISLSSSMPSINSTLLALISASTEPSTITPMLGESMTFSFSSVSSKLPQSSRAVTSTASSSLAMHPHTNSPISTASPSSTRLAHPQTYTPTLTSLAGPILHSQTHSPISANETHNSPTYPLFSHSPPASASQSSPNTSRGLEDATEGDETRITSKEAIPFHYNIPQSDSRNASEYRSKYFQNILGDEEDSLGGMSEPGNREEEEEKEQQGDINDDEITASDMDEQSRDRFVGNRRKNGEKNVLDRKEVNAKKVSLHMKGGHEDEIVTEEEQEEESESSDESNETDKSTNEGLGNDKALFEMKTQNAGEKSGTEMKDEAKLKHKKKRKKASLYNHQDDDDSLDIKKKIRGKLKHKDISERTSLMQKKTQVKEKDNDYTETESQQIRKDKIELDRDSMDTNPSEETNNDDNNHHTPNTATNYEIKKRRRIKTKEKMLDSVSKIRNARHVLQMLPATTTEPPPHFCAKTTAKSMQGLCAQVFSVLVGIKDMMREMTQEGVTREGVHTLQVRRETLGKVVEEAEADVTFPSMVQQKVFVSYLHQLEKVSLCFAHWCLVKVVS
ncbi:hypothetical protein E2C01_010733 [Portunus trituberculatus]|uniref:Uncharacterized protein n=1 Tax=Portunus trituberculatus TaxID=210409 RepID=A0A5B7D980_PORTR|nr:hypothetical protein [Portunus trituberculatus]